MMVADPLQIKKRFEALKAKRASYDSHCEEVAALVLPNYQGFVGQRTANESAWPRSTMAPAFTRTKCWRRASMA